MRDLPSDHMPVVEMDRVTELVELSMRQADLAIAQGDVPIGAVLADPSGRVLAAAHNTQNTDHDPSAHAEINLLRALGRLLARRSFQGLDLVVVGDAEPCSMCVSACMKAGIRTFYYGAPAEPSMGPWLPLETLARYSKHPLVFAGNILGAQCAEQIRRGRSGHRPRALTSRRPLAAGFPPWGHHGASCTPPLTWRTS